MAVVRTSSSSSEVGGYEYTFTETPHHRYVCNICIHPCRDPYLTGCCGHNFCKSCLDDVKKTENPCPCCRNEDFVTVVNKQADREIKSLHVMCTNKERGCEWQGELNELNNHLGNIDGCQFEDVKCSNECGKMLQRQYLTSHIETECPNRKIDCQYCHITGEHHFIEGEHKEQCPKVHLSCPNQCEVGSVLREDIEAHRKECPLEEVECLIECGMVLQRQYLASHVETECPRRETDCPHCQITAEHWFINEKHVEECPKLPLSCPNNCEVGSVSREEMEAHRKECPLEMVQCEYHNVGCEERMMRKRKKNHEEEKMEEHLSLTKISLAVTNQKLDTALKHIDTLMIALDQTITAQELINVVHDVTTVISAAQHSVRLTAKSALIKSGDQVCPVTMNITEFTQKLQGNSIWCSDPFYTHDKGYKMILKVYPDGCGDHKGTHLSVFLCLMKGPRDDELTWPMRGNFNVKLLNQISDCEHRVRLIAYRYCIPEKHFRVTDGIMANGLGIRKFISHEDLHRVTPTCQYLKDDCIFLQVNKL
ncbi:TNF receptor-associated factor 4-like [Dysidea avara]|uniref:TNF receptor-associated factor 4-like n=1 Tax=Dysidea avara TaxID=196820 RepID=UPI003317AC16